MRKPKTKSSKFAGGGEEAGARLDRDVLQHRFFAGGGKRCETLPVAGIHAPAAPRHHPFAIEQIVEVEIDREPARESPARSEIELIEARRNKKARASRRMDQGSVFSRTFLNWIVIGGPW